MEIFFTVLLLIFLEGILSLDNAVVLAVMVKDLPAELQKRALLYGVWGAIGFRLISLFCLTYLIQFQWIKVAGGLYLAWLAFQHFAFDQDDNGEVKSVPKFWKTVIMVEVMDIAFSLDSILASVAVSDTLWIVFLGGVIGILMMRIAAQIFTGLLKKYPWLEHAAYALIAFVGIKLVLHGAHFLG